MAGMWITRLGIKPHEKGEAPLRGDIWSSLPDDIFDSVVARLPLQSLVRMTSVCKKWKIKLRTASFIRQCELESTENAPTEWFLTFGQHQKVAPVAFGYDIRLSKWHSLPLGFLPFDLTPKSLLAAADGLICLGVGSKHGSMPTQLVICNPVSRFWRDVPLPRQLDPSVSVISVAGLVVDRINGTYKLVIVGELRREEIHRNCDGKELIAFVFDSYSLAWEAYEVELNPSASFAFLVSQFRELGGAMIRAVVCSAICDGILYCLTARPYQLHAFNVVTEEWIPLRIRLPEEVSAPSLVARPGRLFLVGAFRYNYHEKSHNIGIWELDFDTERWHVVDILLESAAGTNHGRIHSPPRSPRPWTQSRRVADDDVILFLKWGTRFLAYNVSKKSWLWLPGCVPSAHGSHPFHNGIFFSPSLLLP